MSKVTGIGSVNTHPTDRTDQHLHLPENLSQIWKQTRNAPMAEALANPQFQQIPKTLAIFDALICARMAETGLKREDITVVVGAHRANVIELGAWLYLGVNVIGVEVADVLEKMQDYILKRLGIFSVDLAGLTLMDQASADIPPGDIVQWNMPHPRMNPREIFRYHKPDSYLILQTDEPETFVEALFGDKNWTALLRDNDIDDHSRYLLPAVDMDQWTPITASIHKRNGSPVSVHHPAGLAAAQQRQHLRYFANLGPPPPPNYQPKPAGPKMALGPCVLKIKLPTGMKLPTLWATTPKFWGNVRRLP